MRGQLLTEFSINSVFSNTNNNIHFYRRRYVNHTHTHKNNIYEKNYHLVASFVISQLFTASPRKTDSQILFVIDLTLMQSLRGVKVLQKN